MIFNNMEIPKTHNIEYLQSLLKGLYPGIASLAVNDLSLFCVDVRYPDDFYIPTNEEVDYYSSLVFNIKKLVVDAMKY